MKKLLFLFSLLFFFTALPAQEIEWQNTIGGNNIDALYSVSQTTDGGYILGGSSGSGISGDKTENSQGGYDYWVVKLDVYGDIQWQKTIGGNTSDRLECISPTNDGGYILGGYSLSNISGDKIENSMGAEDYWVVKLNSSGDIQWQNTIGGSATDILKSILQTTDGGYVLGGRSSSNMSGDKTEDSQGLSDYWVIKLDSSGVIQWQNTIGGNDYDELNSIAQTLDGGFILGGTSASIDSGDKTENNQGTFGDYWVVKLDTSGVIQWQNTIGGNLDDQLYSISQTTDSGFILGGFSSSNISGDKTENSKGSYDYWVIKIDNSGNIQWQNDIGGNKNDQLYSISHTIDNGYILGGSSASEISGDKNENSIEFSFDYWIIKLDTNGVVQWQNTIGGNESDNLQSISQTADGGYILGGYSASNISGDKTENLLGGWDYWIIKLTTRYNLIQGNEYADLNINSIKDTSEPNATYQKVSEINTGRFAFTDNNGFYLLTVTDSGNFQVESSAAINYYSSAPLNHNVYFNSILQIDPFNDFAFQPTGSFNDLCIQISPVSAFRSGFNAVYNINYSNPGTTTQNATVVFYPDTSVTFVASVPAPTFVTSDSVVFSVGTMNPFQNGQIQITVHVNQGISIGSLINSSAVILPITGDVNPGCNQSWWEVLTTGSFDPNDILVNRSSMSTAEFPNPPYLDYIIRFQNTGNDTAFTVKILNPIDTFMLDLSTLEYVASSHPMDMSFIYHERNMHFNFSNIQLPDSAVNEPLSHGFIRYRIQPKNNLISGDTIRNFAAIYFDFNNPVLTNTATTAIVVPVSVNEYEPASFMVFPNPAKDQISIQLSNFNTTKATFELYNVYGQLISIPFDGAIDQKVWRKSFEISGLNGGMYFIKVSGDAAGSTRFVKY